MEKLLTTDTDLAGFVNLYKRFEIDVKVNFNDSTNLYWIALSPDRDDGGWTRNDKKFGGYGGFVSFIEFDAEGKFVEQSFLE